LVFPSPPDTAYKSHYHTGNRQLQHQTLKTG
jgi:hypothetical protein